MTAKQAVIEAKKRKEQVEECYLRIVKSDPWVPIFLRDGVERRLEYSLSAVENVFRQTGLNINAGEIGDQELGRLDVMVMMLVEGLRVNDPAITEEFVKSNFSMKHREYYRLCILKAMEATQPDFDFLERLYGDPETTKAETTEDNVTQLPLPETHTS